MLKRYWFCQYQVKTSNNFVHVFNVVIFLCFAGNNKWMKNSFKSLDLHQNLKASSISAESPTFPDSSRTSVESVASPKITAGQVEEIARKYEDVVIGQNPRS